MNSTMGASLTEAEEEAILETWAGLVCAAQNLSIQPGPTSRGEDIVQMLDQAADLVGRISSLRTAIHNGWHYANKRAFPGPEVALRPRRGPRPMTNAQALAALGLTQEDFSDILAEVEKLDESKRGS